MINQLQVYISDSFDPYENLATEKYLLDTTSEGCYTLYLWQNKKTVVIGRNQNPWAECKCSLLESEDGKLARRLSGGGAVFHDLGNLNFTFLSSAENYDLSQHLKVIRTACNLAGIHAEVSGRNDILAAGRKFSGNAFYNTKGKSYHHGTLLISADTKLMQRYLTPPKAKLEAKGVKSVKSRVINLCELSPSLTCEAMKEYMILAFEKIYGFKAVLRQDKDLEVITELAKKYSGWEYLYGTPMPFSVSCEDHFPWGSIQLKLKIKSGIIQSVQAYTDSMDWALPEQIKTALNNRLFKDEVIKESLYNTLSDSLAADLFNLLKRHDL